VASVHPLDLEARARPATPTFQCRGSIALTRSNPRRAPVFVPFRYYEAAATCSRTVLDPPGKIPELSDAARCA
jgi:hypothetical protein